MVVKGRWWSKADGGQTSTTLLVSQRGVEVFKSDARERQDRTGTELRDDVAHRKIAPHPMLKIDKHGLASRVWVLGSMVSGLGIGSLRV
eukprot:481567-Rhodomonas_salina.4